ncbi:MAG: hypothetical protein JWM34_858 [Ilumatobacteraceae bacterium]|nr:hypothetical protein [Ilumatobacteraceae bacterium]
MKLTVTTFLTLDGVTQGPGGADEDRSNGFELGGWLPAFMDPAAGSFVAEWFAHADAFLLGRRTFETFAAFWPRVTDDSDPVARRLNGRPKYVVAGAGTPTVWAGTELITDDLATAVGAIKALPGDEVQVHGSGTLVRALHDLGLIDEYRLWTYPVVLGQGRRLFTDGVAPRSFKLVDRRSTTTGVTISCLRPTGPIRQAGFEVEEGIEVIVDETGTRSPFDQ